MPFANEHSARVRDPGDFQQDSFRRKNIDSGVDVILGKLKGEDTMTVQTYRFDASKRTVEEAKKWLKDNKVSYKSFEAAAQDEEATLKIYGIIGADVKPEQVSQFLDDNASVSKINVRINSYGGDVTDGWAIHDLLVNSGKKIRTVGESKVYSIATIVFLAGTEREMMKNADGLIHNPFVTMRDEYDSADLLKMAEYLAQEEAKILDFYAKETGHERAELAQYMAEETILSAEDMVRLGFATKVIEPVKAYAYINPQIFDIMSEKSLAEKFGDKLEEIAASVKNLSRVKAKNVVITDKDGNELSIDKAEGAPAVGDAASPDGTYVLENGQTIVVMDGKITEILEAAPDEMEMLRKENQELKDKIAAFEADQEAIAQEKQKLQEAQASFSAAETKAKGLITELSELKNTWQPETRTKGSVTEKKGIDMDRVMELKKKLQNAKTE